MSVWLISASVLLCTNILFWALVSLEDRYHRSLKKILTVPLSSQARIKSFLRRRSDSVSSVASTSSLAGETMRKLSLDSPRPTTSTPGGAAEPAEREGEDSSEDRGYGSLQISGIDSLDSSDTAEPMATTEPATTPITQPQTPPPPNHDKTGKKFTVEGSKTVLTESTWKAMHKIPAIELGKLRDLSARNAPLIPPQ